MVLMTILSLLLFHSGYGMTQSELIEKWNPQPDTILLPIVICSDLDKKSVVKKGALWASTVKFGNLVIGTNETTSVEWLGDRQYYGTINTRGRGMEWSDLKIVDGKLLVVDDKTGLIYRISHDEAWPWVFLPEGDGNTVRAYKGEWMTVKDDYLYIGGYGKEVAYGMTYQNDDPLWIKRVYKNGAVEHLDWSGKFYALRNYLQIYFPGFVIYEAVQWSDIHKKWFFLPRALNKKSFTDPRFGVSGSNILLSTSECFCDIKSVQVGEVQPTHTFSAFQFVKGTNDSLIVALKSFENEETEEQNSWIMVFDIYGNVFMDETEVPGNMKFEGIEFFEYQKLIEPPKRDNY